MHSFFGVRKPDRLIISADWLEYVRPPQFDGMIADLRATISRLNASGIRIVLLGPVVQFRSRLPSTLARASLRNVDARADDMVLPDIFVLDRMMQAALPKTGGFPISPWSTRSARSGNVRSRSTMALRCRGVMPI